LVTRGLALRIRLQKEGKDTAVKDEKFVVALNNGGVKLVLPFGLGGVNR